MSKTSLKIIFILFKKELMSYFNSPIAYIFIGVFLVVGNWLFFNYFFIINQTTLRSYFGFLPWIFLFLAPAITMRIWSEEKKSGTIESLLTLPVSDWQVVLGKFFGALVFLLIALLLSLSLPITLMLVGKPDIGPIIGGYLGALLLGGAYISLGMFISALTKNQIIAFVLGVASCFIAFVIGADFFLTKVPELIKPLFESLSLGGHFYNISKGVIDSRDLIYYASFIFLFLWINVRIIESRSWK